MISLPRRPDPPPESLPPMARPSTQPGASPAARAWLPAAALLLTTGCAVAPKRLPREVGATTPPAWAAATADTVDGEPADAAWWSSFGSAELDALVREALAANPDLLAAAARVEAAAAEARIRRADLLPQLQVAADGSRERRNFIGFPTGGPPGGVQSTQFTSFGVALQTSWEPDLWGRVRAGRLAAIADAAAAEADLAAARLSLSGQAVKAWLAATEARGQLVLAEAVLLSRRRTLDGERLRFEAGRGDAGALRIAISEHAAAEADVESWRDRHQQAVRQLEILLGRYPEGSLAGAAELPAAPPPPPVGLPSTLLRRRPDVVAADRRLDAAGARIAEARRARWPSLRLTASGGRSSDELGELLDGNFTTWGLFGSLLAPLFQGGRIRAGIEVSEARGEAAIAEYATRVLTAFADVETALGSEAAARRRSALLRETVEQAGAARREAARRYEAGLAELLPVLEGRRLQLRAEASELAARREELDARVDLHLALGGGFAATGPADSAPVEEVAAGNAPRGRRR